MSSTCIFPKSNSRTGFVSSFSVLGRVIGHFSTVQYYTKIQLYESSEVDENSVVDINSVKLVDESSVVVENTNHKLEGLDEKAVVDQSVFSLFRQI